MRVLVQEVSLETGEIQVTDALGSTNVSACQCPPATYQEVAGIPESCTPCPHGATCLGAAIPPVALPGFGQLDAAFVTSSSVNTDTPFEFYECANAEVCKEPGREHECDCIGGKVSFNQTITSRCGVGYRTDSALCAECDSPDYAQTQGACRRCELSSSSYLLISLISVPVIFFTIDWLSTNVESIEIVLAFLQFVGVFSGFGVAWPTEVQRFLEAFSVFNVDVDMLHLACFANGLTYTQMWVIKTTLVPLVFPLYAIVRTIISMLLTLYTRMSRTSKVTTSMLRFGWRPHYSFRFVPMLFQFLPLGLRLTNIYYLEAMGKVLEVHKCTPGVFGGEDVRIMNASPSIHCSSSNDDYLFLLLISIIPTLTFVVGVPLGYCYAMFVVARKRGLNDSQVNAVFGFLWSRFQPHCYWWELVSRLVSICI